MQSNMTSLYLLISSHSASQKRENIKCLLRIRECVNFKSCQSCYVTYTPQYVRLIMQSRILNLGGAVRLMLPLLPYVTSINGEYNTSWRSSFMTTSYDKYSGYTICTLLSNNLISAIDPTTSAMQREVCPVYRAKGGTSLIQVRQSLSLISPLLCRHRFFSCPFFGHKPALGFKFLSR
jgi:hypothetical protein